MAAPVISSKTVNGVPGFPPAGTISFTQTNQITVNGTNLRGASLALNSGDGTTFSRITPSSNDPNTNSQRIFNFTAMNGRAMTREIGDLTVTMLNPDGQGTLSPELSSPVSQLG